MHIFRKSVNFFFSGWAILACAIIANLIGNLFNFPNWYDFLIYSKYNSFHFFDYIWLFILYPFLIGLGCFGIQKVFDSLKYNQKMFFKNVIMLALFFSLSFLFHSQLFFKDLIFNKYVSKSDNQNQQETGSVEDEKIEPTVFLTYDNHGIRFKYPHDWDFTELDESVYENSRQRMLAILKTKDKEMIIIGYFKNEDNLDVEELEKKLTFIDDLGYPIPPEIDDGKGRNIFMSNNQIARYFPETFCSDVFCEKYLIPSNGKIFYIKIINEDEEESDLKKFIYSFETEVKLNDEQINDFFPSFQI